MTAYKPGTALEKPHPPSAPMRAGLRVRAWRRRFEAVSHSGVLLLLLIAAVIGGVHGCATAPVDLGETAEVKRNEQLQLLRDLEAWSLKGRIALTAGGDSFSGSLFWDQDDEQVDLRFRAPLGLGGFSISGDDDQLEVALKSGESFVADDPEAQIESAFGWPFPVYSLRYWMLGLPAPDAGWNEILDTNGTPTRLDQQGWVVEYGRFQRVEGSLLPTRLKITGRGIRIKMAVDRWEIRARELVPLAAGA
jgi:outer membrane lipoprotein LolB